MLIVWCWRVLLLVVLARLSWKWLHRSRPQGRHTAVTDRVQRLLKPRTPDDCSACRQPATGRASSTAVQPIVTPWSAVRSRRGAMGRINTHGFACPTHTCPTIVSGTQRSTRWSAMVHTALRAHSDVAVPSLPYDGARGAGTLWVTPLYCRKTASQRVGEVLTALAEGLSVSAAVRVFGHRHATITTWLTRAGEHSAMFHNHVFRNLYLPHIQLDELRTRLRSRAGALWLWIAFDPLSKLIRVLHLGSRTQDAAHSVVHDLHQRLAPSCLPVCTSDGLNHSFYALTAHFGQWVAGVGRRARQWLLAAGLLYRQVQKTYRRRSWCASATSFVVGQARQLQQQTMQILLRPLTLLTPLKERAEDRLIGSQFVQQASKILWRQVKDRRRGNRFQLVHPPPRMAN